MITQSPIEVLFLLCIAKRIFIRFFFVKITQPSDSVRKRVIDALYGKLLNVADLTLWFNFVKDLNNQHNHIEIPILLC